MKKILIILGLVLASCLDVFAQPDLPNMATLSQGGINILSWNNPHTNGVRAVTIERSQEEDTGFVQIGQIEDVRKPSQYFTDPTPLPGNNFYRVKVAFNSQIEWYSNVFLVKTDSLAVLQRTSIPSEDSLEKIVSELGVVSEVPAQPQYQISPYVYTNPYNGNINIEFSDALEVAYKIVFYDIQGKEVLLIPRVNDKLVVLDKRNFQRNGLYKFVVFQGEKEYTSGTVSVY